MEVTFPKKNPQEGAKPEMQPKDPPIGYASIDFSKQAMDGMKMGKEAGYGAECLYENTG